MRLLIAGIAALAAVSFAAPSFAQEATDAAPVATPTPTPAVKHKPGTSAYCNSLKSSSQRSSCLKRVQTAKATKPAHPTTKTKKPARAAAAATSAELIGPDPRPGGSRSGADVGPEQRQQRCRAAAAAEDHLTSGFPAFLRKQRRVAQPRAVTLSASALAASPATT